MLPYGPCIGILLLALVTFVAIGIGRIAARSVREFRAEHHERFGTGGR